jgi:hypothetical protein
MKRKSPVIIIVFTLIALALGYFAYIKIIKPLYQNNKSQNVTIKLDEKTKLSLGKYEDQDKIFAVEMEISGKTDNHFNLTISNNEKIVQNARVKGGDKVSFTFVNDWHKDSIYLDFYPDKDESGTIEIECRFLGR